MLQWKNITNNEINVTCPTNTMLPTVTDIAGNAVLAFPDNLTTSNTKIRHGHNENSKMNDDVYVYVCMCVLR